MSPEGLVCRKVTFAAASAEVQVGDHRVGLYLNHWTGRERYSVDGQEVLSVRSLGLSGRRELRLPDGRLVTLDVKLFPWGRQRLLVDGRPLIESLFPHIRWMWRTATTLCAIAVALTVVTSWLWYLFPGR